VWWTDWETEREAEEALADEMVKGKQLAIRRSESLPPSPTPPPISSSSVDMEVVPDLRLSLEEKRRRQQANLRPDLPRTVVIYPNKEKSNQSDREVRSSILLTLKCLPAYLGAVLMRVR